ncbi:MAG TPA: hypothetical protein VK158_04510 [Acidobacteriota bacterium]|nr:hypothetical protein [Acidobacteriota bacterium]
MKLFLLFLIIISLPTVIALDIEVPADVRCCKGEVTDACTNLSTLYCDKVVGDWDLKVQQLNDEWNESNQPTPFLQAALPYLITVTVILMGILMWMRWKK